MPTDTTEELTALQARIAELEAEAGRLKAERRQSLDFLWSMAQARDVSAPAALDRIYEHLSRKMEGK